MKLKLQPLLIAATILCANFLNVIGQETPSGCPLSSTNENRFFSMALSPNGETLAVIARNGVYLFDPADLAMIGVLTCFDSPLQGFALSWSANSTQLAIYHSHISGVEIWDVEQRHQLKAFGGMSQSLPAGFELQALSWSNNNTYIALGNIAHRFPLRVWDTENSELVFEASEDLLVGSDAWNPFPKVFAWSPDDTYLAIARNETVSILETDTWTEIQQLPIEFHDASGSATNVVWSSEGYIAVGGYSVVLRIWDTRTWEALELDSLYSSYSLQWFPNSSILAFVGSNGSNHLLNSITITILDVKTGEILNTLQTQLEDEQSTQWQPIQNIVWLPDGENLISLQSTIDTSTIRLWDVETDEILAELSTNNN